MAMTTVALAIVTLVAYGLLAPVPPQGKAVLFCAGIILYMTQLVKRRHDLQKELIQNFPDPLSLHVPQGVPVAVQPMQQAQAAPQPTVQPTGNDPYEIEAEVLQAMLTVDFGLSCRVYGQPFKAPTYIGYRIEPTGKTTFEQIERVLETMAARLGGCDHRLAMKSNRDVHIILERSRPPILQVTRPVIRPVQWTDRLAWPRRRMQAYFGSVTRYPGVAEPICMPLDDEDHTATLYIGTSGSGKSTLAQSALISLFETTPATELQVWMVDPTGSFFMPFSESAHVVEFADNHVGSKRIIDWFSAICDDPAYDDSPVCRLLVIDEWSKLVAKDQTLINTVTGIMTTGRKKNIRVWVLTQEAELKIVPTTMKGAFQTIFVNYMDREDYTSGQLHIEGASTIERRVESLVRLDGAIHRFNTFDLNKVAVRAEANKLPKRATTLIPILAEPPVDPAVPVTVAESGLRADVLALRGDQRAMHNGRITANKVNQILFPGTGKGKTYFEISEIIKEYYGEGDE